MDKKKKDNGKTSVAVAVWALGLLGVLLLFVIKQNEILGVLKETGFFTKIFGKEPGFITEFEPPAGPKNQEDGAIRIIIEPEVEPPGAALVPEPPARDETAAGEPPGEIPAAPQAAPPVTGASLWFIKIGRDGSISRQEARRELPKNDSPLTTAIQTLLSGPLFSDVGCITLIPEGTKLLSVAIVNRVATLNFSEEFEYNQYGIEGYLGQLTQVVYTATAFSTVDSVQFLIDGEHKEYIGGEGIWIGSPLSRDSFR
jgi:spore germination protein GerM